MSKQKNIPHSSTNSGGLPKVERFQLEGRQQPKVVRQQFERDTRLNSVIRKGLLEKAGLSPTYSQLGAYALNLPQLSNEVWATLYRQIKDYVSDFNKEQQKWFFELYPTLLIVDGISAMDDEAPSDALTQMVHQYTNDAMEVIAALAMAAVWLNVDGSDEFASRTTARLKPSAMRTFAARVGTMPMLPGIKDYILNATRILRYDGPDDVISIYLPLWLQTNQSYIDFVGKRTSSVLAKVALDKLKDFVGPIVPLHKIGAAADFTWDEDGKALMGLKTGANSSLISDQIYAFVERAVDRYVVHYRDNIKSSDSQIARFLTNELGLLTDTVTYDEIVRKVVDNPVGDALEFAKTHMKYFDLPGPVQGFEFHDIIGGVTQPFNDDDGVDTNTFTYRPSTLRKTIYENAAAFATIAKAGTPTQAQCLKIGNGMFVYTADPDELDKLRHFAQLGTGTNTQFGATGLFFKDISFNWSNWKISGINGDAGLVDDLLEVASKSTALGENSFTFGTNIKSFGSGLMLGHTGIMPVIANFTKLFSSQMVYFTGKPGQTVSDIQNMTGDVGHWAMNVEEVENGILRPYWVVTPLVNNRDYMQCGFYNLISKEQVLDETGMRQPNRWSHFFAYGLAKKGLGTGDGCYNPWRGVGDRNEIKDGLVFIGDALGLTPESHFSRLDIAPAHIKKAAALALRYTEGCMYPIKPFVNRSLASLRMPNYVTPFSGITYNKTARTVDIIPAGCTVLADSFISQSLTEINWKLVAWKFWLPDLSYDEDHPMAETLFGYVEEAMHRMDQTFNGKGFIEHLSLLKLSPIGSATIDEAIRRVLKISPKIDRKELPSSFNPKARTGNSSGNRGGSSSKGPKKKWLPKAEYEASKAFKSKDSFLAEEPIGTPISPEKLPSLKKGKPEKEFGDI